MTTPAKMEAAVAEMLAIVAALDTRLDDDRPFTCGDSFTMADVVWAVSLFRMKWIGMAFAWNGDHHLNDRARPNVAAYTNRAFQRPAFKDAVIHWPGVPRTEFVAEHYTD